MVALSDEELGQLFKQSCLGRWRRVDAPFCEILGPQVTLNFPFHFYYPFTYFTTLHWNGAVTWGDSGVKERDNN